jgi:predicted HTH domain antitoxin
MPPITISVSAELCDAMRKSASELQMDICLSAAADWYRQGLISQGRAAELAGLSRSEFIDALAARKIDVVQIDLDSLDRELEAAGADDGTPRRVGS